jgi:hypothetical protein
MSGTYRTAAQERADEMRKLDVPLTENFKAGDEVVVDRKWLRHWSFTGAPAPTKSLWKKLIAEGGGLVSGVDTHGNVYVLDSYDRFTGREQGGFPVPARFVRARGAAMGVSRKKVYRVEVIADDSGEWLDNGMTFPTHEKAEEYAKGLYSRWTLVREWRVVEGR